MGALSNELAYQGAASDSDSSISEEDEELDLTARHDRFSASSDNSSALEDIGGDSEGNATAGEEYFNLALGMSDVPKHTPNTPASNPTDPNYEGEQACPPLISTMSRPTASSGSKRKLLIPAFFKRSSSSKSIDIISARNGTEPQDLTFDVPSLSESLSENAATSVAPSPGPVYRRKKFTRRKVKLGVDDSDEVGGLAINNGHDKVKSKNKRKSPKTGKRRKSSEDSPIQGPGGYSLSTGATGDDLLGIVFLEGRVFISTGKLRCLSTKQSRALPTCHAGAISQGLDGTWILFASSALGRRSSALE